MREGPGEELYLLSLYYQFAILLSKPSINLELERELIHTYMTQKPLLWEIVISALSSTSSSSSPASALIYVAPQTSDPQAQAGYA